MLCGLWPHPSWRSISTSQMCFTSEPVVMLSHWKNRWDNYFIYTDNPLTSLQTHVDAFVNVYNAQCWHLIATYEAQQMYVGRAWLSTGKCVRLVQLMGLQHLDALVPNPINTLPKAKDPIELEERRRIFWAAFIGDRWASAVGSCNAELPVLDIMIWTHLLASHPYCSYDHC